MEHNNYPNEETLNENNSSKTLKIYLSDKSGGDLIGDIFIENGKFVTVGDENEDTVWLNQKLEHLWEPQAGIPVYKQVEGEFIRDDNGKYIHEKYANHGNCTADELLKALYDYMRAFGSFKFELKDR